jgi:hypothetical protein
VPAEEARAASDERCTRCNFHVASREFFDGSDTPAAMVRKRGGL